MKEPAFVPGDADRFLDLYLRGQEVAFENKNNGNLESRGTSSTKAWVDFLGNGVVRDVELIRFWLVINWIASPGSSILKLTKIIRALTGKAAGPCHSLAENMIRSQGDSAELVVVNSEAKLTWVRDYLVNHPFDLTVISQEVIFKSSGTMKFCGGVGN